MYCEQTDEARSAHFCTHIWYTCWQSTFACQFTSKLPMSLIFIFKVIDSNWLHWKVYMWNEREFREIDLSLSWHQSPRSMGIRSGGEQNVPFTRIGLCQGVLANSLIFKWNPTICILGYDIRWSRPMSMCVCVFVCVYSAPSSLALPMFYGAI